MNIEFCLANLKPECTVIFKEGCEKTLSNLILDTQTYSVDEYNSLDYHTKKTHSYNNDIDLYIDNDYILPSMHDIENFWNKYQSGIIAKEKMRQTRNQILKETDYLATIDFPHPTEEAKQAWIDYRQALRDLPANTTDPSNPVWPEAPN